MFDKSDLRRPGLLLGHAAVLAIAVLAQFQLAQAECTRKFLILTIRHEDCLPKRVLAEACRGTCTSYVRPSVNNGGNLERFCQCCDADDVRTTHVIVRCPNTNWHQGSTGIPRFRGIRLALSHPMSCRCRPCSPIPSDIIPAEEELLQAGKRNGNDTHVTVDQYIDTPTSNHVSLPDDATKASTLEERNTFLLFQNVLSKQFTNHSTEQNDNDSLEHENV